MVSDPLLSLMHQNPKDARFPENRALEFFTCILDLKKKKTIRWVLSLFSLVYTLFVNGGWFLIILSLR